MNYLFLLKDLALYDEFNILETLHYFGSLYEMSYKDIIDKGEKLINIMELPSAETQFGSMRYVIKHIFIRLYHPGWFLINYITIKPLNFNHI